MGGQLESPPFLSTTSRGILWAGLAIRGNAELRDIRAVGNTPSERAHLLQTYWVQSEDEYTYQMI